MSKKFTYKASGVDIKAGNHFVTSIDKLIEQTRRSEVLDRIGGFGGLFQPDFSPYKKPVLVSSVDGVGTKLKVAFRTGIYHTLGQDLVNHCVNDIAVSGADPLFFMDYFATGKLEKKVAFEVVRGFTIACRENGCALLGGETAEMPDIYAEGEFDLAGTIVGVVDRDQILDGSTITREDRLYGITGNGLHTNGYSLARKVLFSRYEPHETVSGLQDTLGKELLKIHPSYLAFIQATRSRPGVKAFAHITGGGIIGNTRRVIPEGFKPVIDWNSWPIPPIFTLIRDCGNVPEEDMRQTFNLGIGLVAVARPEEGEMLAEAARKSGFWLYEIGSIGEKKEM